MSKNISIIDKPSIDMCRGFYSNGIHCGLKKDNMLDLGVVFSETNAHAYGVFTTNKVKAAPVIVCKKHLSGNKARLLIVNSKIANACTGEEGIKNTNKVCEEAAKLFKINKNDTLMMSTGVIGEPLPVKKINDGLKNLKKIINEPNDNNFSKAIMTTDKYMKIYGVKVKCCGKQYSIIGTAKGAGMISPNMATMLCFIFTDADINDELLKKAFLSSMDKSFNSISVDGDMSTNDTAIILANAKAENKQIDSVKSEDYDDFTKALDQVAINLAKMIVSDGEGATKLIEININNAKTVSEAKQACMAIAKSSLVKTAFFGEDANWGRIICALGYSGVNIIPEKTTLSFDNLVMFKNGKKTNFNEQNAKKILQKNEITVNIDLQSGNKSWKVWTCDLTYDYVKINASYRT